MRKVKPDPYFRVVDDFLNFKVWVNAPFTVFMLFIIKDIQQILESAELHAKFLQ